MADCWNSTGAYKPCKTREGDTAKFVSLTQAVARCAGVSLRNIDPADVIAYAQRSGAKPDQLCSVMLSLVTGRIVYWKNTPGDCPMRSNVSLGPTKTISKFAGLGLTGLQAGSTVSLAATGGAGIGGSAAGAGATLGGLPALVGTIATGVGLALIPLAVWSIFAAHHKLAVAREQANICDFMQAYNSWEEAMERGLANGTTVIGDVKNAVPTVEQQMMAGLQTIYKDCNAACYMQKSLKALDLYNVEKGYDLIAATAASSTSSLPGASKASSGGGALTLAALSGLGAYAFA